MLWAVGADGLPLILSLEPALVERFLALGPEFEIVEGPGRARRLRRSATRQARCPRKRLSQNEKTPAWLSPTPAFTS